MNVSENYNYIGENMLIDLRKIDDDKYIETCSKALHDSIMLQIVQMRKKYATVQRT